MLSYVLSIYTEPFIIKYFVHFPRMHLYSALTLFWMKLEICNIFIHVTFVTNDPKGFTRENFDSAIGIFQPAYADEFKVFTDMNTNSSVFEV